VEDVDAVEEMVGVVEHKMSKVMMGIIVLVLILGGIFLVKRINPTGNAIAGEFIEEADLVKIPLESISEKAQFYDYEGIEYFVVEAGDGSIKTAFNACDVCYKSKKGYRQEGNDMVCNDCGNHYAISGLGTKNLRGGGCWPGYLAGKIEGNYLVIKKSDLESGRYRF
jgi:uncharacterized membrane protein